MRKTLLVSSFAFAIGTISVVGQRATETAAPASGVRAEFLTELSVTETHMVQLAEATPADKYTWRPGTGVRSISEVLVHVATASLNFPKLIGTPAPKDFQAKGYETSMTDKTKG